MAHTPTPGWSPDSWRTFVAEQQPAFEDELKLNSVVGQLQNKPPLVTPWEIENLRSQLVDAAAGNRFLLQGGDCAERFSECRPDIIANRLKVLLQMSLVLVYGLRLPVTRVGRFAGQYAKPRSSDVEESNGQVLPSYRGDIVNEPEFGRHARRPAPERMIQAYEHSAMTLNYIRALGEGGFADLHHPEYWNLGFVRHDSLRQEYQQIVDAILEALHFMEAVSTNPIGDVDRVSFYTSHEALLLPYEESFTRRALKDAPTYNLSTHFPWIGKRTSHVDGAHVEYARGIRNPLGLKIGPGTTTDGLISLLERLNPDNEAGRITLITRFGANQIADGLAPLLAHVEREGRLVLWACDPMHGNTETLSNGIKTRRFDNIKSELEQAFDLHADHGTILGGVHLELTGENVTECIGGARGLEEEDLHRAYQSQVDPRLNGEQALELAFAIVRKRRAMLSK
ncbi:MAG: 3-deoxy-7-phosphoheptulonate synthase class II [Bacteroidetes Order II. Incertae sedis bacterium]|nr:3-deoxy-7-phosphoheptulonate synthase class II [Bacteroidetes Order II. bacterium]MBT4602321.1 3-deoxy-7-phosphoheptulonate synthase class II [Bacteroidetes Order II. bacterium]MBT5250078.1 3-deoxy-7-phosphoheptulonate synthase class II [Bacteroidetes Order II. bacterium]MBT6200094.1 3-deoxy-7-phosphoheptulonate synthase class II [Bacteroidetes Order II. bacterium]MBT6423880.1 3-deoxy-7-phosphoheptulonate synthase class II [Bacteroidetes Order II. bacterium]